MLYNIRVIKTLYIMEYFKYYRYSRIRGSIRLLAVFLVFSIVATQFTPDRSYAAKEISLSETLAPGSGFTKTDIEHKIKNLFKWASLKYGNISNLDLEIERKISDIHINLNFNLKTIDDATVLAVVPCEITYKETITGFDVIYNLQSDEFINIIRKKVTRKEQIVNDFKNKTLNIKSSLASATKRLGLVDISGAAKNNAVFTLNAGVLQDEGLRILFPRYTFGVADGSSRFSQPDISELRRSYIGVSVHMDHQKKNGEIIASPTGIEIPVIGNIINIDDHLLTPENGSLFPDLKKDGAKLLDKMTDSQQRDKYNSEWIAGDMHNLKMNTAVALEDPRILEYDGLIYIYVTVVKRNGTYYSAVTTHNTKLFMANLRKRMNSADAETKWQFSPLEKLIKEGPFKNDKHVKNFVPFGERAPDGKIATFYCFTILTTFKFPQLKTVAHL